MTCFELSERPDRVYGKAETFDLGPWMFKWLRDELNKSDFQAICFAARQVALYSRQNGIPETTMDVLIKAISAAEKVLGANDCSVALLYLDLSDCLNSQGDSDGARVFESRGMTIFQNYLNKIDLCAPGIGRREPPVDLKDRNSP